MKTHDHQVTFKTSHLASHVTKVQDILRDLLNKADNASSTKRPGGPTDDGEPTETGKEKPKRAKTAHTGQQRNFPKCTRCKKTAGHEFHNLVLNENGDEQSCPKSPKDDKYVSRFESFRKSRGGRTLKPK